MSEVTPEEFGEAAARFFREHAEAISDATLQDRPARASDESWCETPGSGGVHSWSYTYHAGVPTIETRSCITCKYLSVQPIRDAINDGSLMRGVRLDAEGRPVGTMDPPDYDDDDIEHESYLPIDIHIRIANGRT